MNDRRLDLNLLLLFDILIDEAHVSRAAQRAGLSQPAMSHALNRLRHMLNDPVLVRQGARMVPTSTALRLAPRIRELLATSSALVREQQAFSPESCDREFRLGMTDYAGSFILPRLLPALRRRAPGVRIVAYHVGRSSGSQALAGGDVELAVGSFFATKGLQLQPLMRERYKCAVWAGNCKVGDRLTLDEYLAMPHLLVSSAGEEGGIVDFELSLRNLRRNIICTVPHFLVAPRIIAGTDMVLTLMEGMFDPKAAHRDLRLLDTPLELPDYKCWIAWDERSGSDKGLRWLRTLIVEVAAGPVGPEV